MKGNFINGVVHLGHHVGRHPGDRLKASSSFVFGVSSTRLGDDSTKGAGHETRNTKHQTRIAEMSKKIKEMELSALRKSIGRA